MRLIEWNDLHLLVRGKRIEEIAKESLAEQKAPVSELAIRFFDSRLEITGRLDKAIAVPFRVEIRRIDVDGNDVVVRIDRVSAAGLPLPMFLGKLFEKQVAGGNVVIEGPSIRIRVERFLPPTVDVTMEAVRICGEGIVMYLGRGGADPPEGAI